MVICVSDFQIVCGVVASLCGVEWVPGPGREIYVTKDVRLLRDASSLRIFIALSLHLVHQVLPNIISISD